MSSSEGASIPGPVACEHDDGRAPASCQDGLEAHHARGGPSDRASVHLNVLERRGRQAQLSRDGERRVDDERARTGIPLDRQVPVGGDATAGRIRAESIEDRGDPSGTAGASNPCACTAVRLRISRRTSTCPLRRSPLSRRRPSTVVVIRSRIGSAAAAARRSVASAARTRREPTNPCQTIPPERRPGTESLPGAGRASTSGAGRRASSHPFPRARDAGGRGPPAASRRGRRSPSRSSLPVTLEPPGRTSGGVVTSLDSGRRASRGAAVERSKACRGASAASAVASARRRRRAVAAAAAPARVIRAGS